MPRNQNIRCPRCGRRIADSPLASYTKTVVLTGRERTPCDIAVKCLACKAEIGLLISMPELRFAKRAYAQ